MRIKQPMTTWLPSTDQLVVAPERAMLAALDANLELIARLPMAVHVDLQPHGHRSRDPNYEPHTHALLPLAEALVLGAKRLRQIVAEYRAAHDSLLAETDGFLELHDDTDFSPGEDIPF